MSTVIPPMTHPLGKHWDQPDPNGFLIDDTHAVLSKQDFDALHNYEWSDPTGAYEGKVWRRGTQLCWFDSHPTDPLLLRTHTRRILILESP